MAKRAQDFDDDLFDEEWEPDDFGPVSDEPRPAIIRWLLGAIGIILIFLFLTSLGVGWWTLPFLEGRVDSDVIGNDFTISVTNDIRVVFVPDAYRQLLKLYDEQPEHEFKACLLGTKTGTDYHVTALHLPRTYEQSFAHVVAEQCPPETIVSLHTHPRGHCIFSDVDVESYETFKTVNPDGIIGLMCERDRFTFYGMDKS